MTPDTKTTPLGRTIVAALYLAVGFTLGHVTAVDAAGRVDQVVRTDRVTSLFLAAERPVWQHNLRGRSTTVRCRFDEDLGHGRARGPIDCRIRVYRTRDLHGLLGSRTYDVTVVRRAPSRISRDDGTGTCAYSSRRSLYFDLRAPRSTPTPPVYIDPPPAPAVITDPEPGWHPIVVTP